MTVAKVEAELVAVAARITRLSAELDKAREWEAELTTSLRVLHRIAGRHEAGPSSQTNAEQPRSNMFSEMERSSSHEEPKAKHGGRRPRNRSAVVVRAEQALAGMLRQSGNYIRQLDAVQRLRDEHGITIGNGIPGRETSDLSAALGNGKAPSLSVSRRHGWELVEWNGAPPALQQTAADGQAAASSSDVKHDESEASVGN